MNILKCLFTVCLLGMFFSIVEGQKRVPANELIALPEGTVYKQLPNGLHYVIKQNDMPGHKVEFRLILRGRARSCRPRRKVVWHTSLSTWLSTGLNISRIRESLNFLSRWE